MATALRPVGHDDRLSLVEHLDELRSRLIICVVTLVAATGLCLWQNDTVLNLMNRPLDQGALSTNSKDPFVQNGRYQQQIKGVLDEGAVVYREMASRERDPRLKGQLLSLATRSALAAAATPKLQARRPVTLGVGEPFTATFKVAAYAGLLLSLPLLLYQAYAFILPAFSPRERQVALPLMAMVPFLFVAGVVFGWFMVLPPAVKFLQNFNNNSFDVLLQARDYYGFSIMVLAAMGLLFQIPVGILAVTRVGIVTTRQLRKSRRYAILVIAVIAMVLPGQDPVTMLMMMLPMYVLYEGSILLSWILDRRSARARADEEATLIHIDQD